jgi:cation:H+ antiporter
MPELFQQIFLFVIGIVLLYYGADFLVRGGANLARLLGVKPLVIGLTIVAFGTSMPEFLVGTVASIKGQSDIAIGNVVGSNIANIALILGISTFFSPLVIHYKMIRKELIFLLISSLIFVFFIRDGVVFWEGLLFVIILISYTIYLTLHPGEVPVSEELPEKTNSTLMNIFFIIIGITGLTFGSDWLVSSAVYIAHLIRIPDIVIGMTIVAVGTSLPELAASVMAAVKKETDISVGNIIGSNLFNMFFVIGGISLFKEVPVNPIIFSFEIPVMLGLILILFPMIIIWKGLNRYCGIILLLIYIGFNVFLYMTRQLPL